MADDKKTVILEFEVDVDQSVQSIAKLTAANKALKEERDNLNISTAEGKKRAQEINAVIAQNTAQIKENTTALNVSVGSVEELTNANKELIKERNKLNITTKEGQKRAAEINAKINENTELIKKNVSVTEQQKINIGNYGSALDKILPGMGKFTGTLQESANASGGFTAGLKSMAQGIIGATRASLAFIATPIGAILAAISVTIAAVVAYFQKFEFVLDIIENVVTKVTAVFDSFIQNLDKVASIVGDVLVGNFDEAAKKTGELATEFGNAADEAQRLLDATRELEDAELKYRLESAAAANQMKAWVIASKNRNLSAEESNALLQKASDLENELTAQAVKNAQARADIEEGKLVASKKAQLQAADLLRKTGEQQNEYIKRLIESGLFSPEQLEPLIAAYEKVQQEASAGLAFQEKIANQQAALADKDAEARQKQIELIKKQREEQAKLTAEVDAYIKAFTESLEAPRKAREAAKKEQEERTKLANDFLKQQGINTAKSIDIAKHEVARKKRFKEQENKFNQESAEIKQKIDQDQVDASAAVLGSIANLFDENTEAFKVSATAQTLISTYSSAQKSYDALSGIPVVGPALGFAAAAAAVVAGLQNVAAINGVEFAEGGWTGPGEKYQPVGVVHADEYVAPKHIVNNPMAQPHLNALERMRTGMPLYADGGLVTRAISQPIDQNFDVLNIVRNMPPSVVSVKEINKVQKSVRVKENISKR